MTDVPGTPPPDAPKEPLITVGVITAIASALVATLVAFGLKLTGDQQAALLTLVGVVSPLVVALWGRTRVYAPATVRALVQSAKRQ